jgi:hypothetical protein
MENGTFNPTPLPSSFSHLDSLGNAKVYFFSLFMFYYLHPDDPL